MPHTAAIILGASGSVGQALLAEASQPGRFQTVIVLTRRPLGLKGQQQQHGSHIVERLVPDMTPASLKQGVIDALADSGCPVAVGFSVLGVGAHTADLTIDQHRAVDVDLNAAFAAGLKASGIVGHLVFMSAIGANIEAKATGSGAAGMPRYARVKGEAEQAVQAQGPAVVSILRPSVIVGSQHTPAALGAMMSWVSPLLPPKFRPIRTTEIAQAMVALALQCPGSSAIYAYKEMRALISDNAG